MVIPLRQDAELRITVELEAGGSIKEQTLQLTVRETLKQMQAKVE